MPTLSTANSYAYWTKGLLRAVAFLDAREVAHAVQLFFIRGRLSPKGVILFIVYGSSHAHTFSMSQGPEDDLLPWVAGGVLLIAMTIAVAAVAGSSGDQHAIDSLSEPTRGATPLPGQ